MECVLSHRKLNNVLETDCWAWGQMKFIFEFGFYLMLSFCLNFISYRDAAVLYWNYFKLISRQILRKLIIWGTDCSSTAILSFKLEICSYMCWIYEIQVRNLRQGRFLVEMWCKEELNSKQPNVLISQRSLLIWRIWKTRC